jgi:sterol desaturase/sphingolipid hydroxylase (fatty acid hydroxylase superfamily)
MRVLQAGVTHALWPIVVVASVAAVGLGLRRDIEPGLVLLVVNVAVLAVVLAAEQLAPHRRAWSPLSDPQSVNDLGHGILQSQLGERLGGLALVAATTAAVGLRGAGPLWPVEWPMAWQVALGIVVADGLDYWKHRWLHTDAGWRLHALHHGITRLHALRAARSHFGEVTLRFVVVYAPLMAVGAPAAVLVWHAALIGTLGVIGHSNVRLRLPSVAHRLLMTPHVHRLHHSSERALSDSNYANVLPLWDVVFGTFSHPDAHALRGVGVAEGDVPSSFVRQLVLPFTRRP